jgi:hypothetical protein
MDVASEEPGCRVPLRIVCTEENVFGNRGVTMLDKVFYPEVSEITGSDPVG